MSDLPQPNLIKFEHIETKKGLLDKVVSDSYHLLYGYSKGIGISEDFYKDLYLPCFLMGYINIENILNKYLTEIKSMVNAYRSSNPQCINCIPLFKDVYDNKNEKIKFDFFQSNLYQKYNSLSENDLLPIELHSDELIGRFFTTHLKEEFELANLLNAMCKDRNDIVHANKKFILANKYLTTVFIQGEMVDCSVEYRYPHDMFFNSFEAFHFKDELLNQRTVDSWIDLFLESQFIIVTYINLLLKRNLDHFATSNDLHEKYSPAKAKKL